MEGWYVNDELKRDVKGSGRGLILGTISVLVWMIWGKPWTPLSQDTGLWAKIWTRDVQNTKQEY
jgi:hypothetical protein